MALEPVENASGSTHKAEFRRGKQRDLFGEAAEMQSDKRERLQILENEIAIAGRVHRVGGRRSEAEFARSDGAVERKRGAGDRARSERAIVQARSAILQARRIAQNHLHVRQQPVRNQHRLGALQVRIAWHHVFAGGVRLIDQRASPCGQIL